MKPINILLIIILVISLITFSGCCGLTEAGILGRVIEENDTKASQSISSESIEEAAVETPVTEPTNVEESTADETIVESSSQTKTSNELIHGVIPTKVTVNQNYGSGELEANYYWEFYNVGKLGGDYYAGAELTITLLSAPEGMDTSDPVQTMNGYFTGGPNGELVLIDSDTEKESRCYIKNGKELITPNGVVFPIDNPEAFDGWID